MAEQEQQDGALRFGQLATPSAAPGNLTAAQVEGIIRSTARPLPGGNFVWINDAGFGVIDPERCLEQAAVVYKRRERTKES